jgi:hypothetical protein
MSYPPAKNPERGATNTSFSALVIFPAGMLVMSLFLLCSGGCLVCYFLIAAALPLAPLGWDRRPRVKWGALAVIVLSLAMAYEDHEAGMKMSESLGHTRGLADSQLHPATNPSLP